MNDLWLNLSNRTSLIQLSMPLKNWLSPSNGTNTNQLKSNLPLTFSPDLLRWIFSFSIEMPSKWMLYLQETILMNINHLPATVNVLGKWCTFIIGEFIVTVARWWWRCKRTMPCSGHRLTLVKLSSAAFRCVYSSKKKKNLQKLSNVFRKLITSRVLHRTSGGKNSFRFDRLFHVDHI